MLDHTGLITAETQPQGLNERAGLRVSGYDFAEFKNPIFRLLACLVEREVGSFWPRQIKIDLVAQLRLGAQSSQQGDEGTSKHTHARSTPKPKTHPLAKPEQRWEREESSVK